MKKKIKRFGIYAIVDSYKHDTIVYVGKDSAIHKKVRWYDHRKPSKYKDQLINKVLQDNKKRFKYKKLHTYNNAAEMEKAEKYIIENLSSMGLCRFNKNHNKGARDAK